MRSRALRGRLIGSCRLRVRRLGGRRRAAGAGRLTTLIGASGLVALRNRSVGLRRVLVIVRHGCGLVGRRSTGGASILIGLSHVSGIRLAADRRRRRGSLRILSAGAAWRRGRIAYASGCGLIGAGWCGRSCTGRAARLSARRSRTRTIQVRSVGWRRRTGLRGWRSILRLGQSRIVRRGISSAVIASIGLSDVVGLTGLIGRLGGRRRIAAAGAHGRCAGSAATITAGGGDVRRALHVDLAAGKSSVDRDRVSVFALQLAEIRTHDAELLPIGAEVIAVARLAQASLQRLTGAA